MAFTSGVKGHINIPSGAGGLNGFFRQWRASIEGELFEATTWENQTNHPESIRGLHDLKGSGIAIFDGDATPVLTHMQTEDADAVANFELHLIKAVNPSNFTGYGFSGLLSIIDVTVEKRGQAIVVMSFESSGAISTDPVAAA